MNKTNLLFVIIILSAAFFCAATGVASAITLSDKYVGNTVVDLEWTEWPEWPDGFSKYALYRDDNISHTELNRSNTFYRDAGPSKGVTYTYKIEVYNAMGELVANTTKTVTTGEVHGLITLSTTWTLATSPYNLIDHVEVREGARLTIENGITVNGHKSVYVDGIRGTISHLNSVTFNGDVHVVNIGVYSIKNCVFTGGITLRQCNGSIVKDTVVNEGSISIHESHNCKLTYNTGGIELWDSNHNVISNNNCSHTATGFGISCHSGSNNNSISNNVCSYNEIEGGVNVGIIIHSHSHYNEISNNICSHNGYDGIGLMFANNNKLTDNTVDFNGDYGIMVSVSNNNDIDKNRIVDNNNVGVGLTSESKDNTIGGEGNVITGNKNTGILIKGEWTERNKIHCNHIETNGFGLRIQDKASYNKVTNNTIVRDLTNDSSWSIYIGSTAENNELKENTVGNKYPTKITAYYTYDESSYKLRGVEDPPESPKPPEYPITRQSISKYVEIQNLSADTTLFLDFHYEDKDVEDVNEKTLKVWKHNGTAWDVGGGNDSWNGTRKLDTKNNIVGVRILEFCIFAPLAGWPVHNINTREDFDTIQEAIDDPDTVDGHTITVDPEYTEAETKENILVYKKLTIKSSSGNSTDTVIEAADPGMDVIVVTADEVTIQGFTITGATGEDKAGIYIHGSVVESCEVLDNKIRGNDGGICLNDAFKTKINGNEIINNNVYGVRLKNGAKSNIIGGATEGARNIISGNTYLGVEITGVGTEGNKVLGNYIGTDKDGMNPLPNRCGIGIIDTARENIIGGAAEGERNIISGNFFHGIEITGVGTEVNKVVGNYIGTDKDGMKPLPNLCGVEIRDGAMRNIIGGAAEGERNIISGNEQSGVIIMDEGTCRNKVVGNYIGTDKDGMNPLLNHMCGIEISGDGVNVVNATAWSEELQYGVRADDRAAAKVLPSIEVEKKVWDTGMEAWVEEIRAEVGDNATFQLWIHHDGSCCSISGIVVEDTLPEGLEFVSAEPVPNEVTVNPDNTSMARWNIGITLEPCENTSIEMVANVTKGRELENEVSVNATGCGYVLSDTDEASVIAVGGVLEANFRFVPTKPRVCEEVRFFDETTGGYPPYSYQWDFNNDSIVESTEANPTWNYTEPGTYTVTLKVNDTEGNTDTTEKIITVHLPPNITAFAPPSPVNDTVCNWRTFNVTVNQTVNVSWYLNGSLQQTNESVREASCTRHAEVEGEHNVSAIASNENGTDMQTWIWNVSAAPVPVLKINKTDNPDPVSPGGTLNYTIRVNNTGNATATNVTVMETYDGNVTFVSAEPVPAPGNDTWEFTSLNISETRWINISVTVNASVPNGTVLHNIVNVTCDAGVSDSDTENTTVFVAPVHNCTCGDICVNETGWWRDGGAFNPSNTPIQHAINNATVGDTICVKDGHVHRECGCR